MYDRQHQRIPIWTVGDGTAEFLHGMNDNKQKRSVHKNPPTPIQIPVVGRIPRMWMQKRRKIQSRVVVLIDAA